MQRKGQRTGGKDTRPCPPKLVCLRRQAASTSGTRGCANPAPSLPHGRCAAQREDVARPKGTLRVRPVETAKHGPCLVLPSLTQS
eukprot:30253-Pyramimonas_sp.AAC.1